MAITDHLGGSLTWVSATLTRFQSTNLFAAHFIAFWCGEFIKPAATIAIHYPRRLSLAVGGSSRKSHRRAIRKKVRVTTRSGKLSAADQTSRTCAALTASELRTKLAQLYCRTWLCTSSSIEQTLFSAMSGMRSCQVKLHSNLSTSCRLVSPSITTKI